MEWNAPSSYYDITNIMWAFNTSYEELNLSPDQNFIFVDQIFQANENNIKINQPYTIW